MSLTPSTENSMAIKQTHKQMVSILKLPSRFKFSKAVVYLQYNLKIVICGQPQDYIYGEYVY
jgi:hypothetical protein